MDLLTGFFRVAAVAGLASVLTSCWSPLFDQNVSAAALTAQKLSLDAQFDASFNIGSNNNSVLFAVPSRERTPAFVAVFVLGASNSSMTVFNNSGGGWSAVGNNNGTTYGSALADPELVSIQTGMPGPTFSVAVYLPTLAGGTVQILSSPGYSPSSLTFTPTTPSAILGLASFPAISTQSNIDILGSPSSGQVNNYRSSATSAATYLSVPGAQTGVSFAGTEPYGWYAYDETNDAAYLTHYAKDGSGNYTTERIISGSGVVATWTRKDRVVAFLTTGQLLTREGAFYDVCDSRGTIQFSFPAGSLKFAGEYLDSNGAARCSFTEVLPLDGSSNNSSATQRVLVYSVATANLSSLK